jgi:hypothetical protein
LALLAAELGSLRVFCGPGSVELLQPASASNSSSRSTCA